MNYKIGFILVSLLLVCNACNTSTENDLPPNTEDTTTVNSPQFEPEPCEKLQLSSNSDKGERLKNNATIKSEPNGQQYYKIHKDSLTVELSSEDFGDWYYFGFDVLPEYEIRKIDQGEVAKEIWHEEELLFTIYYTDVKKKQLPPWYDNDYISGFVHENDVYQQTIPENGLKRLKSEGKRLLAEYTDFLNQHHFSNTLQEDEDGNCIQRFELFDSHIDGPSAGTRMYLTFVNDTLQETTED